MTSPPEVTLFGGPHDMEVWATLGAYMEFGEVFRGPPGCMAFHYVNHRYNYLRLENGRLIGVYAGRSAPDYPCGATP